MSEYYSSSVLSVSVSMGRAEVPHEVSFSDNDTLTIRKKVGYVLAFLAIAACIVVGLLVYYVGVMGATQCQLVPDDSGSHSSKSSGSEKSTKVCRQTCIIDYLYRWAWYRSLGHHIKKRIV